ncbi:hypothetical protein CEXT_16281 [Caerostris extrusa]|uniref:Uncharacterized protein n=1 Tax=Caerostris extrusa TaxID=172846 RepID=A0AAV4UJN3_CAEEX|nr:hypothetical protein CEXT_16281 [Caerostris extrusa]
MFYLPLLRVQCQRHVAPLCQADMARGKRLLAVDRKHLTGDVHIPYRFVSLRQTLSPLLSKNEAFSWYVKMLVVLTARHTADQGLPIVLETYRKCEGNFRQLYTYFRI